MKDPASRTISETILSIVFSFFIPNIILGIIMSLYIDISNSSFCQNKFDN
jgi:hypothetical protein